MGLAALDAWARMLMRPRVAVPVRYWVRLACALATSALGTALTLPERLALAPWLAWRGRRERWRLRHEPGFVIILGYYRSGTTHLHYLLSCDPRFRTPAWCETLAPQGFAASWWFLRWFLVPFLSSKRPQDDVAIGPEWPAEDDFAVNNWSVASCLPGRMVAPRLYDHYARYHGLERLSPVEHSRWRRTQWAYLRKLAWLARGRALLLKSPSHTARLAELVDLLGAERVRFVHIRRDPEAVVRSNVAMHRRLEPHLLQPAPPDEVVEHRVREELASTERKYAAEKGTARPGHLAEVTYDDLVSDPMGTLRRVYDALGLEWTPVLERRAGAYLDSVRDYRAASPGAAPATTDEPPASQAVGTWRVRAAGAIAALACLAAWIALAAVLQRRYDWIVWPAGIAIGVVTLRASRSGTPRLGAYAAALTLAVLVLAAFPATFLSEYYFRPVRNWEWGRDVWRSTYRGLLGLNNLFWIVMGVLSAYRFASRRHVAPPGR